VSPVHLYLTYSLTQPLSGGANSQPIDMIIHEACPTDVIKRVQVGADRTNMVIY